MTALGTDIGKDVATIVEERAAVLGHARRFVAGAEKALRERRLSAEIVTEVQLVIRTFAMDVAIGLHRDGHDPAGVRAAMKMRVEQHDGMPA